MTQRSAEEVGAAWIATFEPLTRAELDEMYAYFDKHMPLKGSVMSDKVDDAYALKLAAALPTPTVRELETADWLIRRGLRPEYRETVAKLLAKDIANAEQRGLHRQDERVRELEAALRPIETAPKDGGQFGDLDAGTPNHFDPSKRGFQP